MNKVSNCHGAEIYESPIGISKSLLRLCSQCSQPCTPVEAKKEDTNEKAHQRFGQTIERLALEAFNLHFGDPACPFSQPPEDREVTRHYDGGVCNCKSHKSPAPRPITEPGEWEERFVNHFPTKRQVIWENNGTWDFTDHFKEVFTAEIARAKEEMKLTLGCTCRNISPASVHYKDCPLGNAIVNSQALASFAAELIGEIEKMKVFFNEDDDDDLCPLISREALLSLIKSKLPQ